MNSYQPQRFPVHCFIFRIQIPSFFFRQIPRVGAADADALLGEICKDVVGCGYIDSGFPDI